jgi:hypothetical protein
MDADTLAVGRVEAVLDWFAPNGTAAAPLGAVPIQGGRSLNAGVMAVAPSHKVFEEMLVARADPALKYDARYAEQSFLNAWMPAAHGVTRLPIEANLLSVDWSHDQAFWDAHYEDALLIHYVGWTKPGGGVRLNKARTKIVATDSGRRRNAAHALWVDAWTEARLLLGLPLELPGVVAARKVLRQARAPPQRAGAGAGG